jgi:hypothetical protein
MNLNFEIIFLFESLVFKCFISSLNYTTTQSDDEHTFVYVAALRTVPKTLPISVKAHINVNTERLHRTILTQEKLKKILLL